MNSDNPILNSPYDEPQTHYATDDKGALDYTQIIPGRRIFVPDIQTIPIRQGPQQAFFEINDRYEEFRNHLINLLRREMGLWREAGYPNTTRVTKELLDFWFLNSDRHAEQKLFFAQREAIETTVWINEVATRSNAGQHILNLLREGRTVHKDNPAFNLPRIAFKMATGTGKTVVMAMQILYHFFNRREYRNDTRFADGFLIVTPGITIKNRLGVLYVDLESRKDIVDYYHARFLIPRGWHEKLGNLNARIVITNFHAFQPRTLQGNKRSPFDGKKDAQGKVQEAIEDSRQVIRRLLGKFKSGSRLLVLNDEAHHCYLPKAEGKAVEGEDTREENVRAAVWYTGLTQIGSQFKVDVIYDLSATPYFLSGSGYNAYSLFPWVVSDFGLIEAIESGLVKIPFLPESDTTHELTMPVLRNLYEHVKGDLPMKGQKRKKSEARKEGKDAVGEEPPKLPPLVKAALEKFYDHYRRDYEQIRGLFDNPPVFIVVCNNTSVSKEVYKYIAGYDQALSGEESRSVPGHLDLFSNYDRDSGRALRKPPTLLIDSDALENSGQISDDFKKVFASEIAIFKREYVRIHGQGATDEITEAEILREVVNTVGKKGCLGAHIRCVVSVSMLTEGWDANTVTHIMGLRAFGSQLLCEQVAGRALRRKNYLLQAYDRRSGAPIAHRELFRYKEESVLYKFPPEYAHIIGIPFRMFKGGDIQPPPPVETWHIRSLPERQKQYEITFPNVVGYRVETREGPIQADFSEIENFEIDGSRFPFETEMACAFSGHTEKLSVGAVKERREQELFFAITKELLSLHYSDDGGQPYFQRFNQLKRIVETWYRTKVVLLSIPDPEYKKLLFFEDPKTICSHISRGIQAATSGTDRILPVLNFYNKFGSTAYVNGYTSREVYPTQKSHVNYVVADTESWEQIAAKTLDEIDSVVSYAKNAFLGFVIPYVSEGKDRQYFPDFIARCRRPNGGVNLIIEITGMNKDKAAKRWYVENRWLPAVNTVREKYGFDEWAFIEIAGDIRDIKNQLLAKIGEAGR
jgi:type III restriction enzyme